jgi:hypothetical protein
VSVRAFARVHSRTSRSIIGENGGGRFISVGENLTRMPDLTISDDQRERLQRVQDHLAADVAYGHVRPRDAVEYLLDQFDGEEAVDSSAVGVESVADADAADAGFEVRNGGSHLTGAHESAVTDSDDGGESTTDENADAAVESGEATDETRLNSVMSLLDDHEDVWREADGGEAKYEVDLPDGGTERARTKDDVRAVLFKHYR